MSDWFFQLINNISIVNLLSLSVCSGCLFYCVRLSNKLTHLNKQLYQLQNEFRAMNSGHLGMGRKIRKVSQELSAAENNRQELHQFGTSEKIYEQAGLLLSRGATIEEVVESCEITEAEAELLAIMRHSAPAMNQRSETSQVA